MRTVLRHYGDRVAKPDHVLAHCRFADLSLIVGTTLQVEPFKNYALEPERLAIINCARLRGQGKNDPEARAAAEGGCRVGLTRKGDGVLLGVVALLGLPLTATPPNKLEQQRVFFEQNETPETVDLLNMMLGNRRPQSYGSKNKRRAEEERDLQTREAASGGSGASAPATADSSPTEEEGGEVSAEELPTAVDDDDSPASDDCSCGAGPGAALI